HDRSGDCSSVNLARCARRNPRQKFLGTPFISRSSATLEDRVVARVPPSKGRSGMGTATKAEDNAALIRTGYDAFARGGIPGALAVFAEDILWPVPGRGPISGDYRGHAEVLGFFRHFTELSAGTFRIEVDEILAKGDRVVVLCAESAEGRGLRWS